MAKPRAVSPLSPINLGFLFASEQFQKERCTEVVCKGDVSWEIGDADSKVLDGKLKPATSYTLLYCQATIKMQDNHGHFLLEEFMYYLVS